MTFLAPDRLWFLLLLPALVALYVVLQRRRSQYAVRFTNLALLDTVAPRRVNWRQHTAVVLALLMLAGTIVLFARPSDRIRVPIRLDKTYTVVILVDSSYSMGATDVAPSRLVAATQAASVFVGRLPTSYKVSVVTFSQEATVLSPPTTARTRSLTALRGIEPGPFTATGEGIYTALNVIRSAADTVDGHPAGFIVLLSDGKRTAGRSPIAAARAAGADRVPIYTVAVGTKQAFVIAGGTAIDVPVKIVQLQHIASLSGGRAYLAGSLPEVNRAYLNVGTEVHFTTQQADVTSRYLGWLVLLSLVSTAAGLFIASRWP